MNRLVVSFPKSGRTWLRYGLHLAGYPDIPFTHDGFEYNDGAKPSLNFDLSERVEVYKNFDKIIYLERDPRDTIVSLYHQVTGRFDDFFGYTSDISNFIRDSYFGVHNLVKFQKMWRDLSEILPVMIVTYEEMSQDYQTIFKKVSKYLDLVVSDRALVQINNQTSFTAMKDVEQNRLFDRPWLQPRMGANKVRRGKVGGYIDELSNEDIGYIEKVTKYL